MQISFDYLDRPLRRQMFICNPDKSILSIIPQQAISDRSLEIEFNAVSSLNFNVTKFVAQEQDNTPIECNCYQYFAKRRKILLDGIGYFRIISVTEKDDGYNPYYAVECTSAEIEWNDKTLFLQAGAYKFYDSANSEDTLFGKILAKFPDWTLNHIDTNVANRYRTFDYVDEAVYGFVSDKVEKAYECIVDFDFNNYQVNVYDMNNLLQSSSIMLSYDNFLQSADITAESDDVVTALYLTGSDDLQVAGVNPLGGNVIYNFSAYMNTEWMTQGLIDAINAWNAKIANNQAEFSGILTHVVTVQDELITLQGELAALNEQLSVAERQKSLEMSTNQDYSAVSTVIANLKVSIDSKETQIAAKQTELNNYRNARAAIQNELSFENNFTMAQRSELNSYIFQASYTEDNLATTDTMTWSAQTAITQQLYDKGITLLAQLAARRVEMSIDCANFLNIKELESFRSELVTGRLITVKPSDNELYSMLLLGYSIGDDDKLSLKLGNRYRSNDSYKRYGDLYQSINATANTVDINKAVWSYGVKSGKINEAYDFTKSALNATHNAIVTSDDEEIAITNVGLTGKVKNPNTGEYDNEQLRITHNALLLSDDGFETSKCAVGKITLPDGTTQYGVVGDYIVGNLLIGNELRISNKSGSFYVDDNGMHSTQVDELSGQVTDIEQTANGLSSTVSDIQNTQDGLVSDVTQLKQDASGLLVSVKEIQDNGVSQVVTETGYRFDKDGLDIYKSGDQMHNTLDNTGMYVRRKSANTEVEVLKANDRGVEAENVTVRTYLTIGTNSRIENYQENRTGIFYIGGE